VRCQAFTCIRFDAVASPPKVSNMLGTPQIAVALLL